ncbi:hypothetical protein D9619_012517 [Psilocybe cf. subviscida]|uniref:Uncharacterized protein n=1 Tax=Psilocybe cf. subviscida TaxID=2480587 RepID=A0A8H5EZF6_9AGAR|nr:hypothetical protein D9619_012517 [Psilocybe cf. subviscida]
MTIPLFFWTSLDSGNTYTELLTTSYLTNTMKKPGKPHYLNYRHCPKLTTLGPFYPRVPAGEDV